MRYQLRLIGQDLRDLTRQLALEAWRTVDSLVAEPLDPWLLRRLERAIHEVFDLNVRAFDNCGNASRCDASIHRVLPGGSRDPRETSPDPPPVLRFGLVTQGKDPVLMAELLRKTLEVVVRQLPGQPPKGLARSLRRPLEKTLRSRLFRSDYCGESPLCAVNERINPWSRRAL